MRAGVSKKLSDCARQSHETIHREVVLDILARKFGSREKEDVVFLVGALGVIVEVVHHQACPVLRMEDGVEPAPDKARRTLEPALTKSTTRLGWSAGPRPFDLVGRRRR
jgi:hypothetical protein